MVRVSENSSTAAVNLSINKAKAKLEDLQMKGTSLSEISRPSDNPINSVEALTLSSVTSDNEQYLKNINHALMQINITETTLEQITDIMVKAKELAIAQSSDFYDEKIRSNVSLEIIQLRNQALSLANKRMGTRYIFSGHSTLKPPFNSDGQYQGDNGKINLEIAKDFFVPININGREVFFSSKKDSSYIEDPFIELKDEQQPTESKTFDDDSIDNLRGPASTNENFEKRDNIFAQLSSLISALENNDTKTVQSLLEGLDNSTQRLITLRTKIGSLYSSILTSRDNIENENLHIADKRSKVMDADIAKVFSDLQKQQTVLKTTFHSSRGLINQTLLDFIN